MAKAKSGHYQLACAMAFEGVHGCACDTGINHPNQARRLELHCDCLGRLMRML